LFDLGDGFFQAGPIAAHGTFLPHDLAQLPMKMVDRFVPFTEDALDIWRTSFSTSAKANDG
jgi:hypothetical protein